MPVVQTVIPTWSHRASEAIPAISAVSGLAAGLLGPVLAAYSRASALVDIFWINVPLAVGALFLLLPKMGKIPVSIAAARSTGSAASC